MPARDDSHFYVPVESFLPPGLADAKENIQLRPQPGKDYPQTMRIEAPRGLSENHPTGTKFKITAQVIDDHNGLGSYLRIPPGFAYEVM